MKTADPELTQYVSEKSEIFFQDAVCEAHFDPESEAKK
jgi:hypothetical protein